MPKIIQNNLMVWVFPDLFLWYNSDDSGLVYDFDEIEI